MKEQKYSVLMSVYHKEKPEYLRASMESIQKQTVPTDDFVLVCDGPLGDELNSVITQMQEQMSEALNVIRLEENGGLGRALNEGMKHCRHELVARMDSDDISRPERCEKQLAVFYEHPEISIVGAVIEEFSETKEQVESRRIVPEFHDDIVKAAKKRNPFNHPSVMFKRQAALDSGNYPPVRYIQDYYLWVAMLSKGFIGYNIQEPLVWMRGGYDLYKRRLRWIYIKHRLDLFKYMRRSKFITYPRYMFLSFIHICSFLIPPGIRNYIVRKVMRKS